MNLIKIPIAPYPYCRGKQWSKAMNRYHDWCKELRSLWTYGDVPVAYELVFVIPMPKSWSQKKKREKRGTFHDQRPDKDNLEKAFNDGLCYGQEYDDSHVAFTTSAKFWGDEGAIYYRPLSMPGLTLDDVIG